MRLLSITIVLVLLCGSPAVRADEPDDAAPQGAGADDAGSPSRVRLVLPACTLSSIDVGAYAAVVRVELAGDGRLTDVCWPHQPCEGAEAGFIVRLEYLRCDADVSSAVLSVQHLGTGRVEAHTIRLDDVEDEARPRNLALAAVELFRRLHIELSQSESPPEPEEPPPPVIVDATPRAPVAIPPTPSARWRAELALSLRLAPDLDAGLLGPCISGAVRLFDLPVRVRTRVSLLFGGTSDPLGEIDARTLGGALSIEYVTRAGALELELGPHLELGWLHGAAAGNAPGVSATSADDLFITTGLSMSISVGLFDPLRALATLSVGHAVAAVAFGSDGGAQIGVAGPLVDISLGVAVEP